MLAGNFLLGIAAVLEMIFTMVQVVVIASVVISWLNAPLSNPIVGMVQTIAEPMFRPFRKLSRKIPGPLDWAPLLLIFTIILLNMTLVPTLREMAYAAKQ